MSTPLTLAQLTEGTRVRVTRGGALSNRKGTVVPHAPYNSPDAKKIFVEVELDSVLRHFRGSRNFLLGPDELELLG